MKKVWIPCIALMSASPIYGDIWSTIAKPFTRASTTIYKEAVKPAVKGIKEAGEQTYEGAIKPVGEFAIDTTDRLAACATMLGLGTEWAAKQAALYTAQGALQKALETTRGLAIVAKELGKMGAQALNIQEAGFDINASDMAKGKLITLHVKGIFFGKHLELDVPFDPVNISANIERLFTMIIDKIK